jgi:hypothetical protein
MTTRGESGQATVELLVFLPLTLVAACAAAAILATQAATERAAEAARAGAMALLQADAGAAADPRAAAAELLRPDERDGITIEGRRVTVQIKPPSPLRALLPNASSQASADAGPEPSRIPLPEPWSRPPAERPPSPPPPAPRPPSPPPASPRSPELAP